MQEENIRTKHKEEIVKNKKSNNLYEGLTEKVSILIGVLFLLTLIFIFLSLPDKNESNVKDLTYNEFIKMLDDGEFDSVKLKGNDITATSKDQATIYNIRRTNDLKLTDRLLESNVTFEEYGDNSTTLFSLFLTLLPMSDKFGMVGFAKKSNPYLSDATQLLCGSDTSSAIDQEVIRIVKESYETARERTADGNSRSKSKYCSAA